MNLKVRQHAKQRDISNYLSSPSLAINAVWQWIVSLNNWGRNQFIGIDGDITFKQKYADFIGPASSPFSFWVYSENAPPIPPPSPASYYPYYSTITSLHSSAMKPGFILLS